MEAVEEQIYDWLVENRHTTPNSAYPLSILFQAVGVRPNDARAAKTGGTLNFFLNKPNKFGVVDYVAANCHQAQHPRIYAIIQPSVCSRGPRGPPRGRGGLAVGYVRSQAGQQMLDQMDRAEQEEQEKRETEELLNQSIGGNLQNLGFEWDLTRPDLPEIYPFDQMARTTRIPLYMRGMRERDCHGGKQKSKSKSKSKRTAKKSSSRKNRNRRSKSKSIN